MWTPFAVDTLKIYWSQFLYQYVCAIATGLGFIAGDIFNASIILYICVQLDYLIETLVDEESMQLILRLASSIKIHSYNYRSIFLIQ